MRRVQVVADGVVLAHEQRVQQREADPEVARDAGQVDVRLDLLRDQPAVVEAQLAVLAALDRLGEGRVAPVDLRSVPPVRVVGDERRRPVAVRRRVTPRALDLHRLLGPGIVGVERDEPRVLGLVLAVVEPVVHLELDPRAGEQVQRRRGDELVAGQKLARDDARVRLERVRLAHRLVQRHVPPEAAAEAAHQRVVEIVVRAVERARGQVARVIGDVGLVERPAAGVVEVLLAQHVAQADEDEHRDRLRELVPAHAAVERRGGVVVERKRPTGHDVLLSDAPQRHKRAILEGVPGR